MVEVILDNAVRFKTDFLEKKFPKIIDELIERFTYDNPKYLENEKWGYSNHDEDRYLFSYKYDSDNSVIAFSRGTYKYIVRKFNIAGVPFKKTDKTLLLPEVSYDHSKVITRPDQNEFKGALIKDNNGIALGYTSFGKSLTILEAIRDVKQPALVCVHTEFLQKQWLKEATDKKLFNMPLEDIGGCGGLFGEEPRLGKLNLCLYHSLSKPRFLKMFIDKVGVVVQDEGQKAAIDAVQKCINPMPAKYRWAVTANYKRKDKKHFLVEDSFGGVVYEAEEKDSDSKILANLYIVPTDYRDYDYEFDRQYSAHITRASEDKQRNLLILKRVARKLKAGLQVMVFVERKEQACLLTAALRKKGIKTALLIGPISKKSIKKFKSKAAQKVALEYDDKKSYEYVKKYAEQKKIDVIVGTQKAEVGLSVRTLNHGIITTPMGSNVADRLNQIVGRFERTHGSELEKKYGLKPRPTLDILWDKNIKGFKKHKNAIKNFYGDRCFIVRK